VGSAHALRPPPDYRQELALAAAAQIDTLIAQGQLKEAEDFGARFLRRVEPSAAVHYELGLLQNRLGNLDDALRHYDAAIDLDPDHAAARYDRGELLLARGAVEKATADMERAAALRPDHWVVHFRLAELAGERSDLDAMEGHLMEALRHGFPLETLVRDATWRQWAADPARGAIISRIIVVYGDESLLDTLRGGTPEER
jgi:tetratricopeptide (TPR) repeat protein